MSDHRNNGTEDSLNESWVELYFQRQAEQSQVMTEFPQPSSSSLQSSLNGNYERLLIEAQHESKTVSNTSSRGSPKVPNSPTLKQFETADWIWDWSSRPEAISTTDYHMKYKHPTSKMAKLSVRNTSLMRIFTVENIPALFLSHACTFFIGAATVLIYLKKYYKLSTTTIVD